jgi:F-type H+-transporting ATPase subunit epsilon
MANSFQLRIVTPRAQLLDEPVREVTGPGTLGELGVLPDHAAFLTSLEPGILSYKSDHGAQKVAVRGGFAEVVDNVMTILADDAAFAEQVDTNAARSDLQSAEAQLQSLSPVDDSYAAAEAMRQWALARLAAAGARH